ncbi:Catsper1 [Symbiodinium natans]|uniref:Catsper1 protein n=1 Tax=Symbiodinium natans TaxID=878477 RepID=A0A812SGX6_9DINO|nr:Catsper1 [Symbiodinium natans]
MALRGIPASRPCTPHIRSNCTEGRFVTCGRLEVEPRRAATAATLPARDVTRCRARAGQLEPGQALVVQFTRGPPEQGGECTEIRVEAGECWGLDSDGDSYDCLGRCGIGCQDPSPGLCSNWSRNCLKHDICSYYYNSRGGAVDPSCGWAFQKAERDFLEPCLTDMACTLPGYNTKAEVCQRSLVGL